MSPKLRHYNLRKGVQSRFRPIELPSNNFDKRFRGKLFKVSTVSSYTYETVHTRLLTNQFFSNIDMRKRFLINQNL